MTGDPKVMMYSLLSMQVCVPTSFTDAQVVEFANLNNPSETQNGWQIRRQANTKPTVSAERAPCLRAGYVHVILEC